MTNHLLPETVEATEPESLSRALGYERGWLVGNLPVVMQEDDFTRRFVTIFEEIASSVRYSVESSADTADLSVTNAGMIDFLGRWLATPGSNIDLDIATQRSIVQADSATIRVRGTAAALQTLLEAVTGAPVTVLDPGGVFRTGMAPAPSSTVIVRLEAQGHLGDADLYRLVRAETPAHLAIDVSVAGRVVTDAEAPDPTSERTPVA